MKRKIFVAILVIAILAASTLIVFYLTSGPKLNLTLSYDFGSTMQYNYTTNQWYGGSLLGWNASGEATVNDTDAVAIYPFGSISRQFQALDSAVAVSFNWTGASGSTETMTMVVHRQ